MLASVAAAVIDSPLAGLSERYSPTIRSRSAVSATASESSAVVPDEISIRYLYHNAYVNVTGRPARRPWSRGGGARQSRVGAVRWPGVSRARRRAAATAAAGRAADDSDGEYHHRAEVMAGREVEVPAAGNEPERGVIGRTVDHFRREFCPWRIHARR